MTQLLVPGLTCASVFPRDEVPRSGVLVDGCAFYRALFDACCAAERSIVMAGWQFASNVMLLQGEEARQCGRPVELVAFLRHLCERRPDLEVHILAWDASAVFTFEREPLQQLRFHTRGHQRIHYRMDNHHPTGASQHQKIVVVDRSIAFVGGMDLTKGRWDERSHPARSPHRRGVLGKTYAPYHDVQAYVTGAPVDVLREWFVERWALATGEVLPDVELPRKQVSIRASFEVDAPVVGLARTLPRMPDVARTTVGELYELHLRAIASAERVIYIENQYLSCDEIGRALIQRMRRGGPALEIVLVLPEKSAGLKERISIGVYQQRILEQLGRAADETGHQLGVYYTVADDPRGDVPVFIHAKVVAVDDRMLLVSSANTSNRSMGFDTELGVAWEAESECASVRHARVDLLAEHSGLPATELEEIEGLVARLDAVATARTHRLRMHGRNADERPGWLLSRLLPEDGTPFDPDNPQSMERHMPEPVAWLDRVFRGPVDLARDVTQRIRDRRRKV